MNAMASMSEELQRRCVEAAALAPSIHNTQPWRFVEHPGRIDVWADPQRLLPIVDPSARALHMSCGAAAANILVTLAAAGRAARIRPVPADWRPLQVASVEVLGPREPSLADRARFDAIQRRHTSRQPFLDVPVPTAVLTRLRESAAMHGVSMQVPIGTERDRVLALVREAEQREHGDHAYRDELAAWTGRPGQFRPDGVPAAAFAPRMANGRVPLRDFAFGRALLRDVAEFEAGPTLVLLTTDGDEPRDWVRAGVALELVWLDAVCVGLAITPMTQPIELPEIRQLLPVAWPNRHPQMLLRLGVGPQGERTPRRAVRDLLRTTH